MRSIIVALFVLAAAGLPAQDALAEYTGRWYAWDHFLIYRSVDGGRLALDDYARAGLGLEGPSTADFLPGHKIALVDFRGDKEILAWEPGRGEPCFYTVDRFGVRLKHTLTPIGPGRYLAVVETVGIPEANRSYRIRVYSRGR